MAFGEHWEWRAFGHVTHDLQERMLASPPVPPDPWPVEDRYLYAPGCTVNVKLRAGELKVKRFLAGDGDLERWLEDPAEVYPFPLAADIVAGMAATLGVTLPQHPDQSLHQAELVALLRTSTPPVLEIVVDKVRRLRTLPLPGVQPDVLLELAVITVPQPVMSVALEHPQAEPLRYARRTLGLAAAPLMSMSYLKALALWARGRTLPVSALQ